jgi:hypothetical protein
MKSKPEWQKFTDPAHPQTNAAAFEDQLRASMDDLLRKTRTHQDSWGFGEEDQWFLDEGSGEVVFTFPDSVASAPAQVIGKFDSESGLWTWAWADDSLPDGLKEDALRLKEYGTEHGFQHLIVSTWEAEETHCWYMTALACALFEAAGAYRGVSDSVYTFIIFRDVVASPVIEPDQEQVTPDSLTSETVEDFRACLEDPEQQRQACCRYLKRGVMAGIAQDELIHRLGLAAPSVLDLAGYSPELSDSVMAMLKTISDDEILESSP